VYSDTITVAVNSRSSNEMMLAAMDTTIWTSYFTHTPCNTLSYNTPYCIK